MRYKSNTAICLFVALVSCEDNTEVGEVTSVVKETYIRLETGEKQAEKIYTYDQAGNLTKERYYDTKFSQAGYEIQYKYDDLNRRTKLTYIFTDQNSFNTVEYIYEGSKLKIEKIFSQGKYESQKSEYFYSSHLKADSARIFSMWRNGYIYSHTSILTYDNHDRLIEERLNGGSYNNHIIKMNVYLSDLLLETCNPLTHMPEGRNCIKNEYTSQGKLYRVYATLTDEPDTLLEEYAYVGNILTEKNVFNQRDSSPIYNADQTLYTLLVKYQYY